MILRYVDAGKAEGEGLCNLFAYGQNVNGYCSRIPKKELGMKMGAVDLRDSRRGMILP